MSNNDRYGLEIMIQRFGPDGDQIADDTAEPLIGPIFANPDRNVARSIAEKLAAYGNFHFRNFDYSTPITPRDNPDAPTVNPLRTGAIPHHFDPVEMQIALHKIEEVYDRMRFPLRSAARAALRGKDDPGISEARRRMFAQESEAISTALSALDTLASALNAASAAMFALGSIQSAIDTALERVQRRTAAIYADVRQPGSDPTEQDMIDAATDIHADPVLLSSERTIAE